MAGDKVRSMAKAVTKYIGQCAVELFPFTTLIWSCHFYTIGVGVHLVLEMRLEKGSWNSIKSHNVYRRCMLTWYISIEGNSSLRPKARFKLFCCSCYLQIVVERAYNFGRSLCDKCCSEH